MTQTVPDISPLMPMHQDPLLSLLSLAIRRTSKFLITGHSWGNTSANGGFPSRRISNAENIFMSLNHITLREKQLSISVSSSVANASTYCSNVRRSQVSLYNVYGEEDTVMQPLKYQRSPWHMWRCTRSAILLGNSPGNCSQHIYSFCGDFPQYWYTFAK